MICCSCVLQLAQTRHLVNGPFKLNSEQKLMAINSSSTTLLWLKGGFYFVKTVRGLAVGEESPLGEIIWISDRQSFHLPKVGCWAPSCPPCLSCSNDPCGLNPAYFYSQEHLVGLCPSSSLLSLISRCLNMNRNSNSKKISHSFVAQSLAGIV